MKRLLPALRHGVIFILLVMPALVWGESGYNSFLAAMNQSESSGRANVVNSYGYAGLYQMGELALIDAGYYRRDGTSENDWAGQWTGKDGINSLSDFLSNTQAQGNAVTAYHEAAWRQIESKGLDSMIGQTYNGVTITESSLLAGSHLLGVGGLNNCLRNGVGCADGNGSNVLIYLNRFRNYDISDLTNGSAIPPTAVAQGAAQSDNSWITRSTPSGPPLTPEEAFQLGAGMDMGTVKQAILELLSVIMILWTAWVALAQYSCWRLGTVNIMEMQSNIMRSAIVTMLILVFALK